MADDDDIPLIEGGVESVGHVVEANESCKELFARRAAGFFMLSVAVVAWVGGTELFKSVLSSSDGNEDAQFDRPIFVVFFNHCWLTVFLLALFWLWYGRRYARLEMASGERGATSLTAFLSSYGVTPGRVATRGCVLALLYAVPNILWYQGLRYTSASLATAVFNSSAAFVYVFSFLLRQEKQISVTKIFSVVLAVTGTALVSLVGVADDGDDQPTADDPLRGNVLVAFGAILYALFEVVFSVWRVATGRGDVVEDVETDARSDPGNDDTHEPLLVVAVWQGIMGAITVCSVWVLPVAALVGIEPLSWPTGLQWRGLVLNAAIMFAFNSALMFALALLPSLYVAVALTVTIPATMVSDAVFHGTSYSPLFVAGALSIMAGFVLITLKEHVPSWREKRLGVASLFV